MELPDYARAARFLRRGTRVALVLFLALAFTACRREIPVTPPQQNSPPPLRFSPGDYFVYDNWLLNFGSRIPNSRFKNTWTILDTGRTLRGRTRVTIILDSTFATSGQFARRDSLLLSFDSAGDVYQFGFLSGLIAARETLTIAPQWDRIAAFSAAAGTSWTLARLDSTNGVPTPQTVFGEIQTAREYVGFSVNGVQQVILAYRVTITKPDLDYTFWLTDAPAAFARALDESDVLRNATLRELVSARVR
jgi:hypothetical protein